MTQLIALFWLLLALAGCAPHASTTIERSSVDGHDVLHSEVRVLHDVAIFRCIASSSGVCHYAVYVNDCSGNTACTRKLVHQFGVRAGQSLYDNTQPDGFIPCAGVDAAAAKLACASRDQLATATGAR